MKKQFGNVKGGKRPDLGIYVRSRWEANFARYLKWMLERGEIKSWRYEPITFEFPIKKGTRFYTPDFGVFENDNTVTYYEVKGYMTQPARTALKRMAKYHPDIKIEIIDRDQMRSLAMFKAMIPNWETGD